MTSKRPIPFVPVILAIVIGSGLFKEFDRESMTFEKPGLAIVYTVGLAVSIYLIVKNYLPGASKK